MTRAEFETALVARLRGRLSYVNMAVTTAGSNASLNDSMRRAIVFMGANTAGMTVTDADLTSFSGWRTEQLLDVATVETLKVILGQCSDVDSQVENDLQRLGQFADQVQKSIQMLEDRIAQGYGPNIPPPASGVIAAGASGLPNDAFNPSGTVSRPGYWPYP